MRNDLNDRSAVHVLIAEDSPTQAQRLLHILRAQGWRATTANDGRQALMIAKRERPSLVISDVVMPEMDGYELTSCLKAEPSLRGMPVILVTTMSDPQDVIRGLECGADCFIVKPYDEQQLVARMRQVLRNRELDAGDMADGVEIDFDGCRHMIRSDRRQILSLLLSTYDAAVQRNQALAASQEALERSAFEVSTANLFLDSLIENMPAALFVKEAHDLRFVRVNRAAETMMGLSREAMLGKTTSDLYPPDEAHAYEDENRRVIEAGVVEDFAWRTVPTPDRRLRSIHARMVPMADREGHTSHLMILCDDVTERMRAEEQLRALNAELVHKTRELDRARREAEEANRAKSAFLAAMSHEIRTPMNGVLGMVDVLHQTSLKGHQVEMVELIRESALSLLGIIEDVLDFSKIEAGKLELDRQPTSIQGICETACAMLNNLAAKRGVELTLFIDPAIPKAVFADALRLRQVVINLVGNAIKFSGERDSERDSPGRVGVRWTVDARESDRLRLRLSVSDNGIGMDEATIAKLFTSFSQADVSTARRFGGTGLGLAISHHLATLMGGRIEVRSTPGLGSTFDVLLAFDQAPAPHVGEAPTRLDGLHCVVVGAPGGLGGDHAAYLRAAGATIECVRDLAGAARLSHGRGHALVVWLLDLESERVAESESRGAAAASESEADVRVVIVNLDRGRPALPRHSPRVRVIDGNALSGENLCKAIAVAAGRVHDDGDEIVARHVRWSAEAPPRELALKQGRLVLVTEDNETNQKVILRQLGLLGVAADVVSDGRAALERWRTGNYGLLLTDLHMPHMDGYELVCAIRVEEEAREWRRTPIVALSANAGKEEADRCRALGMDEYLSKPVLLADLHAMLKRLLPPAPEVRDEMIASRAAVALEASTPSLPAMTYADALPSAAPPVDLRVLEELVGSNPATIDRVLDLFRSTTRECAAQVRAAGHAKQATAMAEIAHKLKSSARSVGALTLGNLCEQIETEGRAGNLISLAELLPSFEAESVAVEQYLASRY